MQQRLHLSKSPPALGMCTVFSSLSYLVSSYFRAFSRQSKQLPSIINLLLLNMIILKSVLWEASDKAEIKRTPISHLHSQPLVHWCQYLIDFRRKEELQCHLLMNHTCTAKSLQWERFWSCFALSQLFFVWQRGAGSVINTVHQNLIVWPQVHRKQPDESRMTELLGGNYSVVS